MKTAHPTTKTIKSKSKKRTPKDLSAARIAQQYLELRRLRQQVSEVETRRRAR
jgi:hypothetical protein